MINKTHPSLEKALDETNLRDINSWEILENKISNKCHRHEIIEAHLLPIDNHEETPLEFEKGDHIVEHVNYFIKKPYQTHAHMRNLLEQLVSNIITYEILNPLILPTNKIIKRVAIDTNVHHKYCRSCCGE